MTSHDQTIEWKTDGGCDAWSRSDVRRPWPPRLSLLGVPVSWTDYDDATECIITAARERRPALVTALSVHAVITASDDPIYRSIINDFHLATPDGQPVRLALNLLYRTGMRDRVCGSELMLRLCQQAAESSISIYLFGSTTETVTKLRDRLLRQYPNLRIVGCESPPFRPLTLEEDKEVIARLNRSGAGIVFIGLGCPLQDLFAHGHRCSIQAVQVCVGAAFDFLAGTRRRAPRWMQKYALEWLFRLSQEPRRLLKRYTVCNFKFLARLFLQVAGIRGQPESGCR